MTVEYALGGLIVLALLGYLLFSLLLPERF